MHPTFHFFFRIFAVSSWWWYFQYWCFRWWFEFSIRFYVDNAPIRVFTNNEAEGIKFPNKPVAIFGSLWDGSQWATQGGKYKMDLKYAPFVVEMRNLGDVDACVVDPATGSVAQCQDPANPAWWNQPEYHSLTPETLSMLTFIRTTFGTYDYCTDTARFPDGMPPECALRGW
jgi:xyloglucan:xyloglucosyl transferase TCH4